MQNNNQNAIAVTGSNGTYTVDPEQVGDNKMYDMESIGDGTTVGTGIELKVKRSCGRKLLVSGDTGSGRLQQVDSSG